eukprot:jgi/Bigna1/60771/fgenesh1_kg.15_\
MGYDATTKNNIAKIKQRGRSSGKDVTICNIFTIRARFAASALISNSSPLNFSPSILVDEFKLTVTPCCASDSKVAANIAINTLICERHRRHPGKNEKQSIADSPSLP